MLILHFVRGLSDRIIGEVQMHEPKTLEAVVEKVRLAEENIALPSRGVTSGKAVSAPIIGLVARAS